MLYCTCSKAAASGALAATNRGRPDLERVESVLVEGGCTGQPFADAVNQRCAGASATSCMALSFCPNAGWWEDSSRGWKRAKDYGRTANENSMPACNSSTLHSSLSYSEDREQALSSARTTPVCIDDLRIVILALEQSEGEESSHFARAPIHCALCRSVLFSGKGIDDLAGTCVVQFLPRLMFNSSGIVL